MCGKMRGFIENELRLSNATDSLLRATSMTVRVPRGTLVNIITDNRGGRACRFDSRPLRGSLMVWNVKKRRWDANVFGARLYCFVENIRLTTQLNRMN